MDKVIAIVGPTGTGKSDLAITLAKVLDGEVISADSMQVYKGMDIGTAKIRPEEMQGIPHYLLDVYEPSQDWNVKAFQMYCRQAIADITSRGKVPILCGGTGLYIKAALYDYTFDEEDQESQDQAKQLDSKSNEELVVLLQEKDPKSLEKIHPNNRKRLLRAATMACFGVSKTTREEKQNHEPLYDFYLVGLKDDRQKEIEKINQRVDQMFEQGLPQEVRTLFSNPSSRKGNSFQGIGYKEFNGWLDGRDDLESVKEQIKIHTRQYARRQMTWFRRQMAVHWYHPQDRQKIISELEKWYTGNGRR
ncbi:MAG: tRNA (adenosine(37)-N6)-dimethylallyltransferase MiaA [Allobaculum sp.]|nr:tRNA (adenosine(37)-N6)-dimethylallyltransferase MiaA [Allobaculum sp.]